MNNAKLHLKLVLVELRHKQEEFARLKADIEIMEAQMKKAKEEGSDSFDADKFNLKRKS